jgi:1L-myo-inositol 1-phosphate cytidylyltransferase
MKCLIVAAGQGTRLREKGESKPLIKLRELALVEHVIRRARVAGISDFYVVSGYRGEALRAELDTLAARDGLSITHVINKEWDRANGVSVLKAEAVLNGPFVLTMCDHIIDPELLRRLITAGHDPDTVTLAVDFNVGSPLNDPDDVTRVKCRGDRIERIGKVLRDYNAFDTGVFLCTPIMFDALRASQALGDDSISGAMNVLAESGAARAFDIGDCLWVDVDDPVAFGKAERLLEAGRL